MRCIQQSEHRKIKDLRGSLHFAKEHYTFILDVMTYLATDEEI
jgi:hypothetical protein